MLEFIFSNSIAFAVVPVVIYLAALSFNIGEMTDEYNRQMKRKKDDVFNRTRAASGTTNSLLKKLKSTWSK